MEDLYDPFTYLLSEIRAFDAGVRPWDEGLRRHYLETLLIEEAEELANGRRHLTVVHGPLDDDYERDVVRDLYAAIVDWLGDRSHRIGAHTDHHFTVTVDGPDADDVLAQIADFVVRHKPHHWRVLESPRAIT